jgi:hypothetical protein
MAKVKITIEAEDHRYGSYDSEGTIDVSMQESERYRDSIEMNIDGHYVHIEKAELKKAITLLCE